MSDTIAAIATGNVLSAIGILRLSGDGTLAVIDRVFHPANGRPMSEAPNRQLVYGAIIPRNVRLSEAPGFGMPVLYYDRASRGAACYLELADELMKNRR